MLKYKSHLITFLTRLILLFCFIAFLSSPLQAQSADERREIDFFDKIRLLASEPSNETSRKIENLISELNSPTVSGEVKNKILQRLLLEADTIAATDIAKAEIFWQAAELIALQFDDRTVLATSIYYRANSLAAIDKNKRAILEYRRAIAVFQDTSMLIGKENSLLCEIYAAAGETAAAIDEYEQSKDFFGRGWQTLQNIPDWKKSPPLVRIARAILLGQGDNDRQSGDYEAAKTKLSGIFPLLGNDDFGRAELLWELGKLKRDAGDFAAGAADFGEALKLLDTLPASSVDKETRLNLQANLYNSSGLLMLEQRFSKGAERYLEQALLLARELKDRRLEGIVLKNLSIAARQKEDYKTARLRALAAIEIARSTDNADLDISANNILASLAQNTGDHREAAERLQKSLGLAEEKGNVLRQVESRWRLAESLFALGENSAAKKLVDDALQAAREKHWSNLSYLSATLSGRILEREENVPAAIDAFELAIREIEQKRLQVAGADIEKVSFMRDKGGAYHELLKLYVKTGETKRAIVTAEKLKSRVLEDKAMGRKKIESNSDPLSLNIPTGTAVVSYTVTDDACFVFVFRPEGMPPKIFVIAESEKTLTDKIKRFRAGLIKFEPSFKREAGELYQLLLKNLEPEIGDAKNLVIIPDGALWELPFQTLITSEQKYLIEKYVVSYAPSLGMLNRFQTFSPLGEPNQILAFANSLPSSAALPETEWEVAGIAKLYGKTDVYKRTAATEAKFKETASRFKQIHLAVHGAINPLDSFDSALLLAPTPGDDGRLTVSEILGMNLSANLVVLSACDTSSGQVTSGEGLLSLSWAFLASGANNVVAAQWAVEEKATADLMSNFYRVLGKNPKTPATALREAQLTALRLPAPYNHPFYWAAFMLTGNPR